MQTVIRVEVVLEYDDDEFDSEKEAQDHWLLQTVETRGGYVQAKRMKVV
jgi:hypothetical protein